jgi:hypothetical protein
MASAAARLEPGGPRPLIEPPSGPGCDPDSAEVAVWERLLVLLA